MSKTALRGFARKTVKQNLENAVKRKIYCVNYGRDMAVTPTGEPHREFASIKQAERFILMETLKGAKSSDWHVEERYTDRPEPYRGKASCS